MSRTRLRERSSRFYLLSSAEPKIHVHVQCPDGEAKFWLEPVVALAQNHGLSDQQVRAAQRLVEEHIGEIRSAWTKHFGS